MANIYIRKKKRNTDWEKMLKMWDFNVKWKPHSVFAVFSCKVGIRGGLNEIIWLFRLQCNICLPKNRGIIEFHAVKMTGLMGKIELGRTFNTRIV